MDARWANFQKLFSIEQRAIALLNVTDLLSTRQCDYSGRMPRTTVVAVN